MVNDNGMSIAENHGGIYKNLELLRQTGGKAECNLFRAMGLDYVFQPEGNHTDALIETFQQVKDCDHPVVVHIVTEKGKGRYIVLHVSKLPAPTYFLYRMVWNLRSLFVIFRQPSDPSFRHNRSLPAG